MGQHRGRSSITPVCFRRWADIVKRHILLLLESRLCQLGSSWSWGSCSSEMARWTVLRCQISRIQHLLHVPGTRVTYFFFLFFFSLTKLVCCQCWTALHTIKSHRTVETFPAPFESPGLLCRTVVGMKNVKGQLRQRSEQVLKVVEKMEGGRDMQKHTGGESKGRNMKRRWQSALFRVTEIFSCVVSTSSFI